MDYLVLFQRNANQPRSKGNLGLFVIKFRWAQLLPPYNVLFDVLQQTVNFAVVIL